MYNYGAVFRNIRLNKQLSLKETAEGIVSVSLLSKFERGECDITLSKFYLLLNKLNVTLEEYSYISNDYQPQSLDKLIDKVRVAYEHKNIKYLEALMEQEGNKWKEKKNLFNKLNAIMIQVVLKDLNKDYEVKMDDISYLTEYLFKVEEWGLYEITLFGNSMGILNFETIITFSKEMITKISIYKGINSTLKAAVQVLINTIILCFEYERINEVLRLMKYLDEIIKTQDFYYERVKILFLKGIYYIKKGNIEEGKRRACMAIEIMSSLEEKNLAINHQDYLNEVLIKIVTPKV